MTSPTARCIVHVDMDCFYAQVECVRLGHDCRTVPYALIQWGNFIAVNYPARALGVRRFHDTPGDIRQRCPQVHMSHIATLAPDDTAPVYPENPLIQTHKVSLKPYRDASRKIFHILRHSEPGVRVGKAGIDEAYLDVTEAATLELARLQSEGRVLDALTDVLDAETRLIADRTTEMEGFFAAHGTTLERAYDAPMRALKHGDVWPEGEGSRCYSVRGAPSAAERAEEEANCLLLCAASRVVARLRARIYADLHYDCSAGIAHNRLLAKCISAAHKPRQQTLLLPDRSASALIDLPLDKVRGFGGKLGDTVREICGDGASLCRDVWLTPLNRLQIIGSALLAGDDGEHDRHTGRDPLDGAPVRERPRYQLHKDELARGARLSTDMAAAHHAFFRVRGFDVDTMAARIMSKSLIAMKHFIAPATRLAEVLPWVTVLAAELEDRYRDFTSYYHCKGRTLNVKAGTGFVETSDVYNHTVPLPEIVSADTLLRVATRQLRMACTDDGLRSGRHTADMTTGSPTESQSARLPGEAAVFVTPVESVTLTIGGLAPRADSRTAGSHAGLGSGMASSRLPQQSTLTSFFSAAQPTQSRRRSRPPDTPSPSLSPSDTPNSSLEVLEGEEVRTRQGAAAAVRSHVPCEVIDLDDNEAVAHRPSDGGSSSVVALSPYDDPPPQGRRPQPSSAKAIVSDGVKKEDGANASPLRGSRVCVTSVDDDVTIVED